MDREDIEEILLDMAIAMADLHMMLVKENGIEDAYLSIVIDDGYLRINNILEGEDRISITRFEDGSTIRSDGKYRKAS